jgi:hypothetical protein
MLRQLNDPTVPIEAWRRIGGSVAQMLEVLRYEPGGVLERIVDHPNTTAGPKPRGMSAKKLAENISLRLEQHFLGENRGSLSQIVRRSRSRIAHYPVAQHIPISDELKHTSRSADSSAIYMVADGPARPVRARCTCGTVPLRAGRRSPAPARTSSAPAPARALPRGVGHGYRARASRW